MQTESREYQSIWQKDRWNLVEKIIFRFGFAFISLHVTNWLLFLCIKFFVRGIYFPIQNFVKWVGSVFFHKHLVIKQTGSGDTAYHYVEVLTYFAVAVCISIVWTLADRKSNAYTLLLYCLSVVIRIYLGYFSILYGMVKVIKVQFGDYLLINLLTPLGDFSPMGLLWNFMSFSPAYNVFVGLGEVIGGTLLFFRKTTLLGAMILIAVFSNVVMLNFTFDVPVKLFSSLLLLLALILFSLEGKRVLYFFLNQPTIPSSPPVIFEARINRRTIEYIKVLFLIILLAETFASAYQSKVSLPPLYGIYEVESFKLNQTEVSSLGNNEHRWKRMIIDKHNLFYLQNRFGDYRQYQFEPDTTQHNIKIYRGKRGNEALYEFTYKIDETSQMILKGNYMSDTLEILLTHRDLDDFLLTNRGFHWVNEKPFNPFP